MREWCGREGGWDDVCVCVREGVMEGVCVCVCASEGMCASKAGCARARM